MFTPEEKAVLLGRLRHDAVGVEVVHDQRSVVEYVLEALSDWKIWLAYVSPSSEDTPASLTRQKHFDLYRRRRECLKRCRVPADGPPRPWVFRLSSSSPLDTNLCRRLCRLSFLRLAFGAATAALYILTIGLCCRSRGSRHRASPAEEGECSLRWYVLCHRWSIHCHAHHSGLVSHQRRLGIQTDCCFGYGNRGGKLRCIHLVQRLHHSRSAEVSDGLQSGFRHVHSLRDYLLAHVHRPAITEQEQGRQT